MKHPAERPNRQANFFAVVALAIFIPTVGRAQTNPRQGPAGAVATTSASPYHMLHAVAGTKGVKRNGQLYFEDPRSVFRLGDDHQIMVEFEWKGPVGAHKFVGMWKDPSGQVVVVTNFKFAPVTSPYSGYFTLLLGNKAPTGVWTIDATIDGQTAGSYSFEIVSSGTALPKMHPARIPLNAKDIYAQTQAATVFVDKLDASGTQTGRGSGFLLAPGRLVTTFENIDGASRLRIDFPSGQTVPANTVLAWNRWQDWAVLKVDAAGLPILKISQPKSWSVGDHCYTLGVSAGGRTILTAGIIGDTTQPRLGERISLSTFAEPSANGSPLVNQFGEVIGMLGGNLLPGLSATEPVNITALNLPSPTTGLAVPIGAVKLPTADQHGSTLAELSANGTFVPPLEAHDQVGYAALAMQVERKRGPAWPRGVRTRFSLGERTMAVFINWAAKTKFKGFASVHFFNLDNKEIAHTAPLKVKIRPRHIESAYWTVRLTTFSPGIYRVDIDLGQKPAWREFFRITP